MAYVTVPKDLSKIKNKVVFNLTKHQLICIGIGTAMGIPIYFLTKDWIGTSNAASVMMMVMIPAFLFALYEKDGMYLEQILYNMYKVKFKNPPIRRYETINYYEAEPLKRARRTKSKKGGTTRG